MPLLEETGYVPTRKFADGYDIQAHCRRIATQYGLYDQALFHTLIKSLRWDERISRWHVVTDRRDDLRSSFVLLSGGPLHRTKLPGLPGLAALTRTALLTARWDSDSPGDTWHQPDLHCPAGHTASHRTT